MLIIIKTKLAQISRGRYLLGKYDRLVKMAQIGSAGQFKKIVKRYPYINLAYAEQNGHKQLAELIIQHYKP